jgi:hypothetical protein
VSNPLGIVFGLLMLLFVGIWIWSIIWAYGDAESRGKSGCLVVLLILLLSWPIGLLAWIIFRPETGNRY